MEKGYENDSICVLSVGMNRTGTVSLQHALQILYDGKCYHWMDILERNGEVEFWWKACRDELTDEDFRHHFRGYKAIMDTPVPAFYKRLMDIYPNAKVILTIRDPKQWYRSVMKTTYDTIAKGHNFIADYIEYFSILRGFTQLNLCIWEKAFGPTYNSGDETKMILCYEKYVEEVQRYVPADKLLVMNVSEGWDPLCKFLNMPIPNQPFPRVNSASAFRQKIRRAYMSQTVVLGIATLNLVGIGFHLYKVMKP